ncbi:hypothetical protein BDD12DRAFT_804705 [Trichophaea hybrida]|nr:hypothetical protein BDD12DRAFT_804705 [Trichophaea hybrida]
MQAWHKEQKAKAIKKGKASVQKERTEKLARRNPDRLQRQVDELKEAIEAGHASTHNKKTLADLERDLAAVRKARKALGIEDKEPQKRKRDDSNAGARAGEGPSGEGDWRARRREMRLRGKTEGSDSGDSTDSDVADIPLPPGPLPPLPGETPPPKQEVKITYESAPVLRDLRKEAAAFVPVAVKRMLEAQRAQQKSEEEEAAANEAATTEQGATSLGFVTKINAAPDVNVDEEMRRFNVEMEDVTDNER